MCEVESAFSSAFIDWSPDMEEERLLNRDQDYTHYSQVVRRQLKSFFGPFSGPPKEDEAQASILLAQVDEEIEQRFGMGKVVSRYMLCARSIETGLPVAQLAAALVSKLRPSAA